MHLDETEKGGTRLPCVRQGWCWKDR